MVDLCLSQLVDNFLSYRHRFVFCTLESSNDRELAKWPNSWFGGSSRLEARSNSGKRFLSDFFRFEYASRSRLSHSALNWPKGSEGEPFPTIGTEVMSFKLSLRLSLA